MASSFTYGGTDLAEFGLMVNDFTIPELSKTISKSHEAIHGDTLFSTTNYTKRDITLKCSVIADTESQLQSRMDSVKGVLDPLHGDKIITIDDDESYRRFVGRMDSMSVPTVKGRLGKVFDVELVVMAYRQGLSEINTSAAIATDPDTLTIEGVVGNVRRIPAEFYLRNETGATLTNDTFTITNETTSEALTLQTTLEDDRWIRVGTLDSHGRFTASLDKSSSNGSDPEAEIYSSIAAGYVSGDWPRLQGGVDNSITVIGLSTGTLELVYRPRYL